MLGVFVGPALLAVTHAVVKDWATGIAIEEREQQATDLAFSAVPNAATAR
ncbi:MAG TPA: hypothetical protein VF427_00860 [Noviherbaspirillum sp.]